MQAILFLTRLIKKETAQLMPRQQYAFSALDFRFHDYYTTKSRKKSIYYKKKKAQTVIVWVRCSYKNKS